MTFLYCVLLLGTGSLLLGGILEQRRHYARLHAIPHRVLVNGIRGKSSITRLCAGALRGGGVVTAAKTTWRRWGRRSTTWRARSAGRCRWAGCA